MTTENGRPFDGFPTPNFVPVPNVLFDELLPKMSNSELRVILYAVRRTYGFQKVEDWITLDQFVSGIKKRRGDIVDRGCGLSRTGVINGLNQAIEHGYLVKRVICGHCKNEITDDFVTVTRTVGRPGRQKIRELEVAPKNCPYCQNPLRGSKKLRQYYRLRLVNEVNQNELTRLTSSSKRGELELVNEVNPQETNKKQTRNSNNSVVVVQLSSLGIAERDAEDWVNTYGSDRVAEVITASEVATENRAGWMRKALEENWQLNAETDRRKSEQSERAAAIVASLQQDNGGDHNG